jgi:hypothetical protein
MFQPDSQGSDLRSGFVTFVSNNKWTLSAWVLALLAVTYALFITRHRWGKLSPVWKCAILSVVAHLFLIAAAWSTRLGMELPASGKSEVFSLKIVDEQPAAGPETDDLATEEPPGMLATMPDESAIADLLPERERDIPELAGEVTMPVEAQSPQEAEAKSVPELEITAAPPSEFPEAEIKEKAPMEAIDDSDPSRDPAPLIDETTASDRMRPEPAVPALNASGLPRGDPVRPLPETGESLAQKKRAGDGGDLPELYSDRLSEDRAALAEKAGGGVETEQAVQAALKWLVTNQEVAGNWSAARHGAGRELRVYGHDRQGAGAMADTGVTGLAVLALLASGNSHLQGEYRESVRRALEFLIGQQRPDGDLAGSAELFARMYCHAISMLAIGEAMAMTGDERLREPLQRAVDYTIRSQDRVTGGWRYRPGDRGDMSIFGWKVMALKSAGLAGIRIPDESDRLMKSFLQSCTRGQSNEFACYRPEEPVSQTMTAEALLCRHFLMDKVPPETGQRAAAWLLQAPPGSGEINYYYWYYGTLAMFHVGGREWETWNRALVRTLLDSQVHEAAAAGSWNPDGIWSGYGGRVYSTALATLCLEVYYRYAR